MFNDASGYSKVYIACGYTDLRYGIDGLSSLVKNEFDLDPFEKNVLFLFCGRKLDRIKGLLWEGDGFVLIYKRLAVKGRYRWPRDSSEARNLTWQEFDWLMSGLDIEQPKAIRANFG